MATKKILLILFFLLTIHQHNVLAKTDVVRAGYWFSDTNFPVSDIPSTFYTHLYCAFADFNPETSEITILPSKLASFSSFTKTVQIKNPSIQTLLSIGGRSSSARFASMVSKPGSRNSFIQSSVKLARSLNFHGLDLYWEYPKTANEMENMGLLINEWRSAIALESKSSGKSALFLSAAVYYTPTIETLNYPSNSMSKSLDWINLMAYNFTSPSLSPVTRPHAALRDLSGRNISGSHGIDAWIKAAKMPSNKIVFGLPFYGYAWRLLNRDNHDFDAPARGPVVSLGLEGAMTYKEIVDFGTVNSLPFSFNADLVTVYTWRGTTWINYDEYNCIFTKVAYVKQNGLLGYFGWHVGSDVNISMLSEIASQAWEAS